MDKRRYKTWDEKAKRDLPRRSYLDFQRAIEKAITLLAWLPVGNSFTIYDSRSHKAKVQWKRTIDGLKEYRE